MLSAAGLAGAPLKWRITRPPSYSATGSGEGAPERQSRGMTSFSRATDCGSDVAGILSSCPINLISVWPEGLRK